MRGCVAPRVRYESESKLRVACLSLLDAYAELVRRVVGEKFRSRGVDAREWTELDRLMLGIASFDEILECALPLVLETTNGNGALYAHDLNRRVMHCINKHNFIFFYETTSVCETQLHSSLTELLGRMLVTGRDSHYDALLQANFRCYCAWDQNEWFCPLERVCELKTVITRACDVLPEDVVILILNLLGVRNCA
jgi:hypothetical protein